MNEPTTEACDACRESTAGRCFRHQQTIGNMDGRFSMDGEIRWHMTPEPRNEAAVNADRMRWLFDNYGFGWASANDPPDDDDLADFIEDLRQDFAAERAAPKVDDAIRDVITERAHQDAQWGEQNHPPEVWLAILSEEVGEMAKEMLPGGSLLRVREEAVQVAAVAVAFIEAIGRAFVAARLAAEKERPC